MGFLGAPSSRNNDAGHHGLKSFGPHRGQAASAAGERTWVRQAFSQGYRMGSTGLSKEQKFRFLNDTDKNGFNEQWHYMNNNEKPTVATSSRVLCNFRGVTGSAS